MAAPCRHFILRNGRFLANHSEQLSCHRSLCCTTALKQQAASVNKDSTETIVIPRKKTWSKVAVLEALASTVSRDQTSYPYQFHDDPYLSPRSAVEFKLYSLALESGKNAAKYFVNSHPKFFTKDFAEPHIPCLMPQTVSLCLEEVSEEALKERISLRKVSAAVDMYDQLLQAGTTVSMEATHDLLDLICLYGDKEPAQEDEGEEEEAPPQIEDAESAGPVKFNRKSRYQPVYSIPSTWKENNNAERIFNTLPERDTRCYSALIRGMVTHGAYEKAFSLYTDMLNERVIGDIHIFNALISATQNVPNTNLERWTLITDLLTQMKQQKIQPNLLTFNSVLRALRRCGTLGPKNTVIVLNEMKSVGIAPSLASFNHILSVFIKSEKSQTPTDLLQEVLMQLNGVSLTCQDPEDVKFFNTAMKICVDNKDLDLGYKVHRLVQTGENWRLLGNSRTQGLYYNRFFSLLCLMEHIDVVLEFYRQYVPSVYYLNSQGMKDLMQALDTDSRLDLLPQIWQDICDLGHDRQADLVEEVLLLMSRDTHSPEVQKAFATCALAVKSVYDPEGRRLSLKWSPSALANITTLLLRADMTEQAWDMLLLFRSENRVPPESVMKDFLSACQSSGWAQRAVDLVELSASFCLPITAELAKRTLAQFTLSDKQRSDLSELESAASEDK